MTARIASVDPTSWNTFPIRHMVPKGSGLCLDLGCGPGAKQELSELGYCYLGLDCRVTPAVDVIADAAKLPFAEGSFDLVVAASSFEHFPDPWAAAREVFRVLRPGGVAIVSLSFLEPYHAHSYFHMTHLGAAKLFQEGGLEVEIIEPFEWTGIEVAVATIFHSRVARWLMALLIRPILWLRRYAVGILSRWYFSGEKRDRAIEFLEEERFRFTAGIKLKLIKPIS